MTLDWNSIRPLNGGRDKGFEELCAQLARAESPTSACFERKGTPDAGVECYAVFADDSEWGWQAKYFDTLGHSQWGQIDKSVRAAISKHPQLVRYFVCIPLDRPDARIEGQKSAKGKWDLHVKKWTKWAAAKGMSVEFVFWGSHELLERLARPENVGRVRFWFDIRGFDAAWFNARLNESLLTAGPRYTPEVHVELPIALELDAFGRTERFFERQKSHARTIREAMRILEYSEGAADSIIDASIAAVSAKAGAVLAGVGAISAQPTGALRFTAIAQKCMAAEQAAEELSRLLDEREREFDGKPAVTGGSGSRSSYRSNPFRDRRARLFRLTSELRSAREALTHADGVAGSTLMLLRGVAGTGKTHLLCDVARQRIGAGSPTVLLMGQRFVSSDAPWSQALQQLDLANISAEEFVGSLEAAAQAAGSRALVVIDAINEGAGRTIWPSHLPAFLAHLTRSPWIGVVLSVRSSYEELIVPADVRTRATAVTHHGFSEHEYDATRTFFVHYGLELPSTPLLAPEFRNPLFLKTLCRGLNAMGERRLPRGFQGITAVFNLYLSAVNERLAPILGFDARSPLVRQALSAVTTAILESGDTWLTLAKAAEVVNALLPGRDFERSLYRGLVVEGVLVEEATRHDGVKAEEIVFAGYERFADHLAARALLDTHLDVHDPGSAFAAGGPLAFVCDKTRYVSPGLLEALCIQIPERTRKELISIAPTCAQRWGLADAFRQSLVWRDYNAFSDSTRDALSSLCRSEHDMRDTIDVLLTVAALPEHPLNAKFLDGRLRKDTMPDRDAWWSVRLHHAWGNHGAVDRLVDWATSLETNAAIDDETIDMCAIALAWMLTTSNRYLRDRATKALVNLLTSRLAAVTRLVKRFADVDDPYVTERIFAVAYGVAMRSQDPAAVDALATLVYSLVFESGSPPPHILLRDYARGVIERALDLGSDIIVDADRIRPPYKSTWPTIPTDEDVEQFLPDWSKGSHDSGELEWSRNRIGYSVMSDDFAHYVIGTNSSSTSRDWLSITLDDARWTPPNIRMRDLLAEFSDTERKAWEAFDAADKAYSVASLLAGFFGQRDEQEPTEAVDRSDSESLADRSKGTQQADVAELEEQKSEAVITLDSALTAQHARRLKEILSAKETQDTERFDLRQVQRYVLKRVFELGWTIARFGSFDRFEISYRGREAAKAERIGKKYQWIAYHEIMAFMSDQFRYREQYREEDGDQAYEGPWQDHLRDIDPSCTIRSLPEGNSRDGHAAAWWGPPRFDAWGDPTRARDWILKCDDLPLAEELLIVTNPTDGSRWLNCQGSFNWRKKPPVDRESTDVERGELWYLFTGYLVRSDDAQSFLKWAEGIDFWGRWMPEAGKVHGLFLGEHAWSPASRYFQTQYFRDDGWEQPRHDCPVKIRAMALEFLSETNGFDCSVDETFTLHLPVSDLVTGLGIRWSGRNADFLDATDRVAAQDPTVLADGPRALLLREDLLKEYLERENLTICWSVLGEKRVLSPGISGPYHPSLRMSGAFMFSQGRAKGFMKHMLNDPHSEVEQDPLGGSKVVHIARTKPQ